MNEGIHAKLGIEPAEANSALRRLIWKRQAEDRWREIAEARERQDRARELDDWEPFKRSDDDHRGLMFWLVIGAVLVTLGALYVLSCGAVVCER